SLVGGAAIAAWQWHLAAAGSPRLEIPGRTRGAMTSAALQPLEVAAPDAASEVSACESMVCGVELHHGSRPSPNAGVPRKRGAGGPGSAPAITISFSDETGCGTGGADNCSTSGVERSAGPGNHTQEDLLDSLSNRWRSARYTCPEITNACGEPQ